MLPLLFIIITVSAIILLYFGSGKDKRLLLAAALWTAFTGILAFAGFFEDHHALPPRMLLAVLPPLPCLIWYCRKRSVRQLQPAWLLAVHALRLPVELVLYYLFLQEKVPVIMTFKGWNFDILTGISAILLLFTGVTRSLKLKVRALFIAWNIAGLFFLAFIVSLAVLSAPLPIQRLAFDQPDVALLFFPYTWLPAVVVPVVLMAHILSLRSIFSGTAAMQ